ncbi:MAG: AraC family transcriptional regulator [bacterium]|nr:AraC family transcriptional regulator [bacterium]
MHLPAIEALQDNMVLYSKTSRQYKFFFSDSPASPQTETLNRMPLHGKIEAVFPYHYELRACDAYLLLLTDTGQGRYLAGNTSIALMPGTLLFQHCQSDYTLELSEAGEWNYQFLYISGSMVSQYYAAYRECSGSLCTLTSVSVLPSYFERLFDLYQTGESEKHYDFLLSNLLSGLLTTLLLEQDSHVDSVSQLPPHLTEIKDRIDAEYMQSFSLDELAREVRVSKYKLVRDFTAHLGISPINYLISVRIEHAKRLLVSTRDPVNEIASAVGIDNMNHFIYLFKKSEGMTPGAYRKACYYQKRNLVE